MTWDYSLVFDPTSDTPRFIQICRAITEDIGGGRLRPGDPLPGSRTLAGQIGVHRNTVVAAYETLVAEGWLMTQQGGRTCVAAALPHEISKPFVDDRTDQPVRMAAAVGFPLCRPPSTYPWQVDGQFLTSVVKRYPADTLILGGGCPDLRLFPGMALARAYRRVLRQQSRHVLSYAAPAGHPRLRAAIAAMLAARRGLVITPDNVLITRGSQMALHLIGRALCAPGDIVAVESYGYPTAWEALHISGARLVPVDVDAHGMVVEKLAALMQKQRVRAVYVTPHHQYPTQVSMSPSRRLALLRLAQQHGTAIIEDDYDHEFHYDGQPTRPIASADGGGVVVYVGTLSKILAPGLRLGYAVGPQPLIDRMTELRGHFDVQGDLILECAIAELSEDGDISRHIRSMRQVYHTRRDALVAALRHHLGHVVRFDVPKGGVNLWVKVRDDIDVEAWERAALAHKVAFFCARRFAFDGQPRNYLRLCFGGLSEPELDEAVRRMAAAYHTLQKG